MTEWLSSVILELGFSQNLLTRIGVRVRLEVPFDRLGVGISEDRIESRHDFFIGRSKRNLIRKRLYRRWISMYRPNRFKLEPEAIQTPLHLQRKVAHCQTMKNVVR
jgi:hypothetical protein